MKWTKIISHDVVLIMVTLVHQTYSLNVMVIALSFGSHSLLFGQVAEELVSRGHSVTFIAASTNPLPPSLKKISMNIMTYHMDILPIFQRPEHAKKTIESALKQESWLFSDLFEEELKGFDNECEKLHGDTKLLEELKKQKFDIAVTDFMPCYSILAYKLNIPFTYVGLLCPPSMFRQPDLPSFVPSMFLTDFTDDMSFLQRLFNTFMFILEFFGNELFFSEMDVAKYAPERPFMKLSELQRQTAFCFSTKTSVTDYAHPSMPNMAQIKLMARPSKPIKDEKLLKFLDSATHGVIIMSFGSHTTYLPDEITLKLMSAFSQVKEHVVWRFPGKPPSDVPENVMLMKWLPQNDIMGHPNTKLLIMHGGYNTLVEAVYQGIPMICIPIQYDQRYVASFIEARHYGVRFNIVPLLADELVVAIRKVIDDPSYKGNISLASDIMKDEMIPAGDVLDYWLKHIVKFGTKHIRSHALDMSSYTYLMLDIFAFIAVCTVALIAFVWYLCSMCKRCLFNKKKSKTD